MSGWGISPKASDKEKIKSEYADYLNGLNSCGEIDYSLYSEAFDIGMELMDKCYEQGKKDAVEHGRWIDSPNIMECVVCSNCLSDNLSAQVLAPAPPWYKFCPNCGAKMDIEEGAEGCQER